MKPGEVEAGEEGAMDIKNVVRESRTAKKI
jgi:hypothetical protein